MCGRTCLTLEPQQILCACKYKKASTLNNNNNNSNPINKQTKSGVESKDEIKKEAIKDKEPNKEDAKDVIIKAEPLEEEEVVLVEPEWRKEYNCGLDYSPCFNIAPQSVTPVIVSSQHFSDAGGHERVIMPMLWGMIPFWHRGDFRKHGLTTNNCRLEHMLESKLYEGPFRRGQRCVVLCEGFYEWQTTKSAKPSERNAYLLYMPQQDGVQIWNKSTWLKGDGSQVQNNLNLLKLAGIFDVWTDSQGDKIYSYSVITFESSNIMSWLHHRMPAILETEQQVDGWLDYKRVPYKAALGLLRPATSLKWHRVSKLVNNSRNKNAECNVPIEMVKSEKPKTNMLTSWLLTRKRISEEMEKQHGDSSGTSDSEEGIAFNSKRPRFHDYKKLKTKREE